MSPRLLPLTLALGLAWQTPAQALGLGEWHPLSSLGEPFAAEAPLLHAPGESVEASCFHLQPASEPGMPTLARGRFSLREGARGTTLRLESDSIVKDPVVRIAVRVDCGANQTRVSEILLSPRGFMPPALPQADAPGAPPVVEAKAATARPAYQGNIPKRPARPRVKRDTLTLSAPPATLAERGMKLALELGLVAQAASDQAREELRRTYRSLMQLADVQAGLLNENPLPDRPAAPSSAPLQEAPPIATPDTTVPATPPLAVAQPAVSPVEDAAASSKVLDTRWLWPAVGLVVLAFLIGMALAARRKEVYKPAPAQGEDYYFLDDVRTAALLPGDEAKSTNAEQSAAAEAPPAPPPPAAKVEVPIVETEEQPSAPAGVPVQEPPSAAAVPPSSEQDNLLTPYQTVLEVANTMVAYGRVTAAAEALEDHIRANPNEAVQPWLRLLELLHHAGLRDEFEDYAGRMRKHFNVAPPAWDAPGWQVEAATPAGEPVKQHIPGEEYAALERFPHLVERIVKRWGTPECKLKLDNLLRDTRQGTRQGLPLPVVDEVLFLLDIADMPQYAQPNPTIGAQSASRSSPPNRG